MTDAPTYKEFDAASGRRARLYYSAATGRLDPDGDAELTQLHATFDSTPASVVRYAELANRPYYQVLLPAAAAPAGAARLFYRRPLRQLDRDRDRAVPFEPESDALAPPVVLFLEPLLVPLVAGRVSAYSQKTPRAATGALTFQTSPE